MGVSKKIGGPCALFCCGFLKVESHVLLNNCPKFIVIKIDIFY